MLDSNEGVRGEASSSESAEDKVFRRRNSGFIAFTGRKCLYSNSLSDVVQGSAARKKLSFAQCAAVLIFM